MAIIKAISSTAPLKTALGYVDVNEKNKGLCTGINCNAKTAFEEMQSTKEIYQKTDGRQYKHFVQSFAPEDKITPEEAHQIGQDFIKKSRQFDGYEVVISTHQDKGNIHNHFIVNSVSFENGKKFQQSKDDLQQFRKLNDELCQEHNLIICEKGKTMDGKERGTPTAYNHFTYDLVTKADRNEADSWTHNIAVKVVEHAKTATSREDFIKTLDADGVRVVWNDNRKNIVFEDKDREEKGQRYKVRNGTLGNRYNLDLSKEGLENGFTRNHEQQRTTEADRRIADYTITRHQQRASGANREIDNLVGRAKERADREREQAKIAAEQLKERLRQAELAKQQSARTITKGRTRGDDFSRGR